MECRSTEKRLWIVETYDVVPVAHIQLLAGQTKHSDAGQTIKNDYYIFEATNKQTEEKEIIQCGMGAARDFLRLLEHEGLPVFNPLHRGVSTDTPRKKKADKEIVDKKPGEKWNPVAEQLYNAIMWIIIIIDAKPNTPVYELREKVFRYKYKEPFPSQIKAVNTIISRNFPKSTLTQAINDLRKDNDVRDNVCQFDLLVHAIENMTDKDGKSLDIHSVY